MNNNNNNNKLKILIISVLVIILIITSVLILIKMNSRNINTEKSKETINTENDEQEEIWYSMKVEMYDNNKLTYEIPSDLMTIKIDKQEIEICLDDGTKICNKEKYEKKDNKYLVNNIESLKLQNAEFEKIDENELILNGTVSETQKIKYYFHINK